MSTRAAAAANASRAKKELIRILFQNNTTAKSLVASPQNKVDYYSYAQLRSAYLQKLQILHPDKNRSSIINPNNGDCTTTTTNGERVGQLSHQKGELDESITTKQQNCHEEFVKLQDAWDRYDEIAKRMKQTSRLNGTRRRRNGEGGLGPNDDDNDDALTTAVDANFTMFGVGCSFADNEEERERRNEIMEQASRGWFSAGALSYDGLVLEETSEDDPRKKKNIMKNKVDWRGNKNSLQRNGQTVVSLADDDMFITVDQAKRNNQRYRSKETKKNNATNASHSIPTLVQNKMGKTLITGFRSRK